MARTPRKEGARSKKGASGRGGVSRGAPKSTRKPAAKVAKTKAAKTATGNRRASVNAASLKLELNEARARQAATAEILKIIASSPADVKPVFEAIVRTIVRVMRCDRAFIMRCAGKSYYPVANALADGSFGFVDITRAEPIDPELNFPSRAIVSKKTVYYPDRSLIELPDYERMISERYGANASLFLPLLRQDECIGVLALASKRANAFSPSDIALAESFRDQALIAIENARLFHETNAALERQTATSDILKVIASSPDDVQPVFDAIAESARSIVGGRSASVTRVVGDQIHLGAFTTTDETGREKLISMFPQSFSSPRVSGQVARTGRVIMYADIERDADEATRDLGRARGYRSVLGVPMLRDGVVIGTINVTRVEPGGFDENTISLMKTFADQAVIAIENARLFNETREALAQQTATSEVLQVISSSAGDLQPVFDQMLAKATHYCGAEFGVMGLFRGDFYRRVATHNLPSAYLAAVPREFQLNPEGPNATARRTKQVFKIDDLSKDERYLSGNNPAVADMVEILGVRTLVIVPMLKDDEVVGVISIFRQEARPFTDRQIELLKNFASQAVIAIENARLFNETREALERQTATAGILKVIAGSPDDVQPVFDAIAESARRVVGAHSAIVTRVIGDQLHLAAFTTATDVAKDLLIRFYPQPLTSPFVSASAEAAATGRIMRYADAERAARDRTKELGRARGWRSLLVVPMLRDGAAIGTINVTRTEPGEFDENTVGLLKTFADQAVIAIENARLFNETKESLQQQTATSDVLRVIAASPTDVKPVLDAIVESACKLCEASDAYVALRDGDDLVFRSQYGPIPVAWKRRSINRQWPAGRAVVDGKPVHLRDILANEGDEFPDGREIARQDGARGILTVPLMREGESIGVIILRRTEVQPFTDKQMALLKTFADQAVIAIENARLFNETREALERQTATSEILKVIASSPDDVRPVFDAIAESARRVIGGHSALVTRVVGDELHLAAFTAGSEAGREKLTSTYPQPLSSSLMSAQVVRTGRFVFYADTERDGDDITRGFARARGYRSVISVPMLRDGVAIGTINVTRVEPGAFDENTVRLLKTFADQAVIAIENVRLFNETKEALAQQTATSEVLSVISNSVADTAPVFEKILDSCEKLFASEQLGIFIVQPDGQTHVGAFRGAAIETVTRNFPRPVEETATGIAIRNRAVLHIPDTATATDLPPTVKFTRDHFGDISHAVAPMLTEEGSIGAISVTRQPPNPFSDKELALLKTFADQAVIAIQNTRLFNETREALARQTATADVLKVIASSPSNLQPVFDAIAERSNELIAGHSTTVFRFVGNIVELAAATSVSEEADAVLRAAFPRPIAAAQGTERLLRGEIVETVDATAETEPEDSRNIAGARGFRSRLMIPLKRDDGIIGFISITRKQPGNFADKDVELLQTFADQAVIAIQNVELFEEVQARTRDLQESLQQQTATADVLKVISRSAFDLHSVLQTLVDSAAHLCDADKAFITRPREGAFYRAEAFGFSREFIEYVEDVPIRPDRGTAAGRALLERRVIHIADVTADAEYTWAQAQRLGEFRTIVAVPMLREGTPIGVLILLRSDVRPFTDKQIELVTTFADQAVIAIENTRLFNETTEALERQTATADILKVIASSPDDVQPVFQAIADQSKRLLDGLSVAVYSFADGIAHLMSFTPVSPAADADLKARFPFPLAQIIWGKAILDGEIFRVIDTADESIMPRLREVARNRGWRSAVFVPLLSDGRAIGAISVTRIEPGSFADHHVEILRTFADQAVIAISNVELFQEVQQRTRELSHSLDDLRTAQDRLVQTEKLASLGQLTAGIAHEIKNPLNFVNNFSALSVELTDELNEALKQAELAEQIRQEVGEITHLLKSNLEKVVQHGKRADSIVKNMLLHSREGSGEQRAADINSLVEESLNLAYHGARAEKSGFTITLQRQFDAGAGSAELFPQEMTRALLNLISNGFYAATRRKSENGDGAFEPTLLASTKDLGGSVEIRIRDNGIGIPPEVKEKMFNPFFTTKPAGEGTGLGLSMTHDIIVKQHGGTIDVTTEPGNFTEFIVVLPRANGAHGKNKGDA